MPCWLDSVFSNSGNGYIEGKELDGFLREFVASVNQTECGPEVCCSKTVSQLFFASFYDGAATFLGYWRCPHFFCDICRLLKGKFNFLLNVSYFSLILCSGRIRCHVSRVEGVLLGSLWWQPRRQDRHQRGSTFATNKLNNFNDNRMQLAQLLPMEENFLLLFRFDNPLDSSVEFMKVICIGTEWNLVLLSSMKPFVQLWHQYDTDGSGSIEADELKVILF